MVSITKSAGLLLNPFRLWTSGYTFIAKRPLRHGYLLPRNTPASCTLDSLMYPGELQWYPEFQQSKATSLLPCPSVKIVFITVLLQSIIVTRTCLHHYIVKLLGVENNVYQWITETRHFYFSDFSSLFRGTSNYPWEDVFWEEKNETVRLKLAVLYNQVQSQLQSRCSGLWDWFSKKPSADRLTRGNVTQLKSSGHFLSSFVLLLL